MADQIPDSAKMIRIALEDVTPVIAAAFADDPCLIWSGEHRAYWVAGGHGYTTGAAYAGRWTIADAYQQTKHCDPTKQIAFERVDATRAAPPAMDREAVDFLGMVGRLTHSGDDGWTPDDADDATHALDALIAKARTIANAAPVQSDASIWDSYRLPCDVHLAPVTIIRAGCQLSTLKVAMEVAHRPKHFDGHPNAALSADAIRQGEGVRMPADIAEHVRKIGKVEWGQTPAHDADGHGRHVADSVRLTAANFGQTEDQHMHGLWLAGTETVLCHTGTSPNAPMTTQALVGAWNWLVEQALATPASHASDGGEGA